MIMLLNFKCLITNTYVLWKLNVVKENMILAEYWQSCIFVFYYLNYEKKK